MWVEVGLGGRGQVRWDGWDGWDRVTRDAASVPRASAATPVRMLRHVPLPIGPRLLSEVSSLCRSQCD